MVRVASMFNQLLHHFPRLEFAALVTKHQAERSSLSFLAAARQGRFDYLGQQRK